MTRTHARAGTSQGGNDGDLPPSPSLFVNEFVVDFLGNQRAMEDTLCLITWNTAHAHQQHQGLEPNQYSTFKDFQDTKPPIFKEAEQPLQANEWLNTIEQKFCLLRVIEQMMVEYASHQL